MEPTVTKRLHISGLTPSISQQDLSQRLSTFGNVKSLDGVGLLDGTGRPRKFAYATLEATPAKLSKCLNTLSGATWKGTKLRIGEAKPDFHERIKTENEKFAAEPPPPRKKSRISKYAPYRATHAKDMTPVTLESAKLKGGWVVTPLGRVYRPLRMKPLRPLPPLPSSVSAAAAVKGKGKGKDGTAKVRKRVKKPDVRARRRKIDMVKYGSVYLKGRFLDADVPEGVGGEGVEEVRVQLDEGGSSEEEEEEVDREEGEVMDEENEEDVEEGGEESGAEEDEAMPVHQPNPTETPIVASPQPTLQLQLQIPTTSQSSLSGVNLELEKQQSLNLLASLFGGPASNDEDDWIGKESPGSDVDEADLARSRFRAQDEQGEEVGFEIVPQERGLTKGLTQTGVGEEVEEMDVGMDVGMDVDEEVEQEEQVVKEPEVSKVPSKKAQKQVSTKATTQLKDLFAPSEAEGGFSLLGHLNLDVDLELDEDIPFPTTNDDIHPTDELVDDQNVPMAVSTTTTTTKPDQKRSTSQVTLDPSKPLFFPLTLLASHPSVSTSSTFFPLATNPKAKNRPKDLYDTLKEKGWDWRSVGFYRTESEDEIRKRWEEERGELTRGWKKRWREAGRVGRRRGRGGDGEDV